MMAEQQEKTTVNNKTLVDSYNYAKNVFCSSKKLRPVLDLVKGQSVSKALHILENCSKKKCAGIIAKGINAAVANGVNNKNFLKENLYLGSCYATKGKTMKRLFPRAKGSSNIRYKHVSNVYIGLINKLKEGA